MPKVAEEQATARFGQRGAGGVEADLGHERQRIVVALGQGGIHPRGVEHAGLVDHVALFDARRRQDELRRGMRLGLDGAFGDGIGMLGVEEVRMGVERRDQFVVGDGLGRCEDAGAGDRGLKHVCLRES